MYNSNLAYKLKPDGKQHDINIAVEKRMAKIRKTNVIKVSCVLIFIALGAMSLLFRNVQVTEQNSRTANIKAEYIKLESENKKREIEINKKIDLKTVEEIAVSSYGMNRARKEQIVPIDIEGKDYGVITKNNTKNDKDTKKINILTGLLAYFD